MLMTMTKTFDVVSSISFADFMSSSFVWFLGGRQLHLNNANNMGRSHSIEAWTGFISVCPCGIFSHDERTDVYCAHVPSIVCSCALVVVFLHSCGVLLISQDWVWEILVYHEVRFPLLFFFSWYKAIRVFGNLVTKPSVSSVLFRVCFLENWVRV